MNEMHMIKENWKLAEKSKKIAMWLWDRYNTLCPEKKWAGFTHGIANLYGAHSEPHKDLQYHE